MAVDNPTVVPEAASASQEWQKLKAEVSALLLKILERIPAQESKDEDKKATQNQNQTPTQEAENKAPAKGRELEIQLGKNKIFKGIEGQAPKFNSMSPTQAATISKLMDTPSTSNTEELASAVKTLGGKVLTVRVDREPVLRLADGQLENNLYREPERTAEAQTIQQPDAIAPEPQPEATPEPQPEAIAPEQEAATLAEQSDPQPEAIAPERETEPEAIPTAEAQSKALIPPDFGIESAKGITPEKVVATGDRILMYGYGQLEELRVELNETYQRSNAPGFEYIRQNDQVRQFESRFDELKASFENRLNEAIAKGKYVTTETQLEAETPVE
ncbi:MAG TPA: hypothetical protein V6D19_21400, partial [Stenomitos sp.]